MGRQRSGAIPEWIAAGTARKRLGVSPERMLWMLATKRVRCRITSRRLWPEFYAPDIVKALHELPKVGLFRDRRRSPTEPPGSSGMNQAERVTPAAKQASRTRATS
ncbi:hypothetical protein OJF2_79290 (plasmid) [Aquisphaera giovannonii]|uniref:Uncharacterized protein n=1 Tax=Aquisphaera giovannonii TaxID=406548 RepID=A0A5B9WGL5_9BACT|nr:hypothetical protein [Aquisphaera giovannonii]QEH39314.1 hypothetical protein OJF2_79290 [Aquisphaera giovannonii]